MEEQIERESEYKQKCKEIDSKAKKFLTILGTSLLLLIPIGFMSGIIHDRTSYRDEAVSKVAQSWAGSQTIASPTMSFTIINDKKVEEIKELELNNYEANVVIKTEVRKKGIFKVPVYTAEVSQKGDFNNKYGNLAGKEISTAIGLSDSRGFVTEPTFKINGETANVQDIVCKKVLNTSAKTIPFEITYKIKGLNDINVALGGYSNKVAIQGNWKDRF